MKHLRLMINARGKLMEDRKPILIMVEGIQIGTVIAFDTAHDYNSNFVAVDIIKSKITL